MLMDDFCVLFLLCPLFRSSSVSVVFDFNALLNDVAPDSPILLAVYLMRIKQVVCLWMPFVCCLLCSPLRSSSVSVVFDFNASLNDIAPVSSMLLPVHWPRKGKE